MKKTLIVLMLIFVLIEIDAAKPVAELVYLNTKNLVYHFNLKVDLPEELECMVKGKFKIQGEGWTYEKGFEGEINKYLSKGTYPVSFSFNRIFETSVDLGKAKIECEMTDIRSKRGNIDVVYRDDKYISSSEITVGEYKGIVENYPRQPDYSNATYPVVRLTYNEAENFCEKTGGRLLSVKEWEDLASYDNVFQRMKNSCNFADNQNGIILGDRNFTEVNGVYNLAGNVWEFVQSSGDKAKLKGGSWLSKKSEIDINTTEKILKDQRAIDVGFRIIWD